MSVHLDRFNPALFEKKKVEELQPETSIQVPLVNRPQYTDSTIQAVEKTDAPTPLFRPKLENPALMATRCFLNSEKSAAKQAQFFDSEIATDLATVDRLSDEKEAAIRDFVEKEKTRKSWGMLTTIFQYLASAAAIFLGIAAIATGQVLPGVLMIVGAGGSLAHRMAVALDVYQKIAGWFTKSVEVQNKIARRIEMVAFAGTLITSLIGGIVAFNAGAFGNATEKLAQSVQAGTTLMSAGLRLKEGYLQKRITEVQVQAQQLGLKIDQAHQNIDGNSMYAKKMAENLERIASQLKQIINACGRAAEAA